MKKIIKETTKSIPLPCDSKIPVCLFCKQAHDVKQNTFFRLFCLVTKENGKNWDHWGWHSLTHIFVYSQGTVLICQGNTFRCGR